MGLDYLKDTVFELLNDSDDMAFKRKTKKTFLRYC